MTLNKPGLLTELKKKSFLIYQAVVTNQESQVKLSSIPKPNDFIKVLFNNVRLYPTSAPVGGHEYRDQSWSRLCDQITPTEDMQDFEELCVISSPPPDLFFCCVPIQGLIFFFQQRRWEATLKIFHFVIVRASTATK